MNGLIPLFPTLIYRDAATVDVFDLVQNEIKDCLNKVIENDDLEYVSYIHEEAKKRRDERVDVQYNFFGENIIGRYELVNLKNRIFKAVDLYIRTTQWNRVYGDPTAPSGRSEYKPILRDSWINIQTKISHEWHCHPGYTISGVYYHTINPDMGGIQFQNPVQMMQHCQFPECNRSSQSIEFIPSPGDIILFPSWLMHNTMTNTTDEERISLAFNLDIEIPNLHRSSES